MKALFVLAWSAGLLSAQQEWIVDQRGGPGVDFLDFPPALAAASAGDTILVVWFPPVVPGSTGFYTPATIDKAIRVVGIDGLLTSGASAGRATFDGRLEIENIPAGQTVLMSNLVFTEFLLPETGLWLHDCDGSVVLEDVYWVVELYPEHQFLIDSCLHVTLRGCTVWLNGSAMHVKDSDVLITSTIIGHDGWVPPVPFPQWPSNPPGLDLLNSSVSLVGSAVEGARFVAGTLNDPAPAVLLDHSTLRVGVATRLLGGSDSFGYPYPAWHAPNGIAGSVVELDPRTIVNELSSSMWPPTTHKRIDAAYHSYVIAGQDYGLTLAGPPGGFAVLAVGNLLDTYVPIGFGELAIDPFKMHVIDIVPLPSVDGAFGWVLPCPSGAPSGAGFAFQGLTLSPAGEFGMTLPSPFMVAWELGAPW